MATIAEILQYKWPGAEWSITEDRYETLNWMSTGIPKPTQAEIRQHSSEVNQLIAAAKKAERQRENLLNRPESMLEMIDALADFARQLAESVKPASLSKPLDTAKVNALIDKINFVKNIE